MGQVVPFPSNASRTARRMTEFTGADEDGKEKVVMFTGVWHERVERRKTAKRPKRASKAKE